MSYAPASEITSLPLGTTRVGVWNVWIRDAVLFVFLINMKSNPDI